jgi:hypothetical protein
VLGGAIVVSMLVPRWKCGGHLILRRSRASETEIEMLIDQACARILGDSFANYARQAEFTRGTPQQRLLFRGSAELMEDHIRNHMPRNTKSSEKLLMTWHHAYLSEIVAGIKWIAPLM